MIPHLTCELGFRGEGVDYDSVVSSFQLRFQQHETPQRRTTEARCTASRCEAPHCSTERHCQPRFLALQHTATRSNTKQHEATRSNTKQHEATRSYVLNHDVPHQITTRTMATMHLFNSELFPVIFRRNHCCSHVNLLICGLSVQLRSKSDRQFVQNNKNSDYRHGYHATTRECCRCTEKTFRSQHPWQLRQQNFTTARSSSTQTQPYS